MNKNIIFLSILSVNFLSVFAAGDATSELDQKKVEELANKQQAILKEFTSGIADENTKFSQKIADLQKTYTKPEDFAKAADPIQADHDKKIQDLKAAFDSKMQELKTK